MKVIKDPSLQRIAPKGVGHGAKGGGHSAGARGIVCVHVGGGVAGGGREGGRGAAKSVQESIS